MKCSICKESVLKARREPYVYRECGLGDEVTLINIEVRRCPRCGATEPIIPRLSELHWHIALTLTRKPGLLDGREIRFLRSYLGHSSKDFASLVGVQPETASRWENDRQDIGVPYDALLRTLVVYGKRVETYDEPRPTLPEEILALVRQAARPTRVQMKPPTKTQSWSGQLVRAA